MYIVKCAGQYVVEFAFTDRARRVGEHPTPKDAQRARRLASTVNPLKAWASPSREEASTLARGLELTYPGQVKLEKLTYEQVNIF